LEVGVGSGKFALPLGIKTGVDPAGEMLKKAASAEIKVFRGVAESLPFADQSFDFVLMVTTICFVDNLVQSFMEAFRVLKDTGFIVVGFVDKDSNLGRQYLERKEKSKFYRRA
jgi:ubiquinone/menaquinone biosynthesis C-methylase UbiE